MKFQDAIQLALITCLVFVLVVLVWVFMPTFVVVRDPSSRWPHVRLRIARPTEESTASVASTRRSVRRMLQRRRQQERDQESNQEPLPKYSLRGQPGAGVSLQLGSSVVIDERDSGAVVVRSVQPVVASASIPIALPDEPEPVSRERSRSSAAELYVEPVSPRIAPSGALPVVHVTLTLPPPPGYNDKSGVPIEYGAPVQLSSPASD